MNQINESEDTPCYICIHPYTADEGTITMHTCGHKMHSKCLFEYIDHQLHKTDSREILCPACRGQVMKVPRQLRDSHTITFVPQGNDINDEDVVLRKKTVVTFMLCLVLGANILYLLQFNAC